jgi:energy-coupling factor transporter ATP-binding protein EcfA2
MNDQRPDSRSPVARGVHDTESLRGRLAVLRARLDTDVERTRVLASVAAREVELGGLLRDLDRQLERTRGALVVVVAGPTGAGKSTLVNALCGEEVSAEGIDRPTTSAPTVVAPLDADLEPLLRGLTGPPPRVLRRAAPRGGAEYVLVDAPDVNSVRSEHRATVRALVERADVVVACLHRQALVEAAVSDFLDDFAHLRRVVWVLGRTDELADAARAALERQLAEVSGAPDEDRFALSALAARGGGDVGFERLAARLAELAGTGALGVRCHNALGAAAALGELFGEAHAACDEDLAALPARVAAGLDALVDDVGTELDLRLSLRGAPLARQLVAEAGERWNGPGGFALRVGGLAALGTGLGLLVGRRVPLAGAALAVGGAVASGLGREHERRALADGAGLLPEQLALDALWRRHLADARLCADRLLATRAACDFPESDVVLGSLAEAAGQHWRRLVERELVLAAERSVPVWLRWPLDLPLLALVGFVAWRVVEGFVVQSYVGLDFLVNAALVGLLVLWLVRALVVLVARVRVGRLVAAVRRDMAAALAEQGAGLVALVRARVDALRDGLAALTQLEATWRRELLSGAARSGRAR